MPSLLPTIPNSAIRGAPLAKKLLSCFLVILVPEPSLLDFLEKKLNSLSINPVLPTRGHRPDL